MRVSRQRISLLFYFLLLTLLALPTIARADDDDEDDDYDVKARVVRISLLGGDINLKRNGNKDWETARLNYPLVEGDTVATGKDSYLEIQIDSRNFVRLAANSVLRMITLRDEGVAVSVVEGTATVRLAKFDRKNGYFEIDAPKTTMAAEKDGLYRIDVRRDGRVRLTVRNGGSARIYSDTSGFTLRDGRSAELIVTGETAGDWEFIAAAPNDAVDDWVSNRERDLAQRLKYDVKYFDESVWGAEDLDAYGDWNYTDEYGWIWRPHSSAISAYSDWAPYRYGNWTWCPPYGWTWIGYEPWGWAPYHYGRWVYYNNYWAWVPRSKFHRHRSWWRPALVAFVINFSFGDNICWYPLSYYQRDPHSRHYRRDHRYRDRDRDRRHEYGNPRGVTRVPRHDFGNPERRGQPVEAPIARRVVDLDPERGDGDLPRREKWGRGRDIQLPVTRTGAAERAPGVALDEELRRSRVFRGREPRPREVIQPGATTTTTPATVTETQPTGAVARPEPRPRREPRSEPPVTSDQPSSADSPRRSERSDRTDRPDGSERRGRRQEAGENPPANVPEPRNEQPKPRLEAPRETPRSESPRSQPSRSESPRSEAPRSESPRPSRSESPRSEAPSSESPRPSRSESPRSESPRSESPRPQPSRSESPRSESPRSESPRSEAPRSEPPRSDPPRSDPPRSDPPRSESPRPEPAHPAPAKPDRPRL